MKFIKDSIRELKHVVWPTREESRKYFFIVTSVLTLFGLYLFIFSTIFSKALFLLEDLVRPSSITIEKKEPEFKIDFATGTTSTGNIENSTGVVEKNISTGEISTGSISN